MKVGDNIKIKISHGYFKKGHTGRILGNKFIGTGLNGKIKTFDFMIRLDGEAFNCGFDRNELELEKERRKGK